MDWRLSSISNGQQFQQSCQHNESPYIPLNDWIQRATGLVNTTVSKEGGMSGGGMAALHPTPPHPTLFISFISLFLNCIYYHNTLI